MKNIKIIPVVAMCLMGLVTIPVNKGYTESARDKVKSWVDDTTDALKKGIDSVGENIDAIQNYLDHYSWQDVIDEQATSGPATLKHLKLNGHPRAIVVGRGEKIDAEVRCNIDSDKCTSLGVYRVVVGLRGDGPQAIVGNETGFLAGKTKEKFTLTAPYRPGIYQIQFRTVETVSKQNALDAWLDELGEEPGPRATIGVLVVK